MPTNRHLQSSINAGEFDPLLWSREDVSFFYNSARKIENIIPLPQGGGKRRDGWRFRGVQRGEVTLINLGGTTITGTNGGTVANATDGIATTLFTTTTAIGTTADYEIIRVDFGTATDVSMVDLVQVRFVTLPSAIDLAPVSIQGSTDGSSWTTLASFDVGITAYNRRFSAQPDTAIGTYRYWRLVCNDGTDITTAVVEFAEMSFHTEAGKSSGSPVLGDFTGFRLTASITNEFIIVMVKTHADIYLASTGAWVAGVAIPHVDNQVKAVKPTTYLDTAILYHEDVNPFQIQRLSGTINWGSNAVIFDNVVEFPFGDENVSGGINAVQFVAFSSMSAGNDFVFEYNGEKSSVVTWSATAATNITNMTSAIEGLADITDVTITSPTMDNYEIEFVGVDSKTNWPIQVIDVLTGSGVVTISHKVFGKPDTDDLWSDERGYPSCGTFYQGRHWMGGFRSRKDLVIASRAGSPFVFKQDALPVAGSPIVAAPDTDEQIIIQDLYPGRHLQIFTSSMEMYVPEEPITVDNIGIKIATRHGSQTLTQPVDIQGGTLFLDSNGRALREFLFTDGQASYTADPVSILAGHLVANPASMALRRARDVDEPTILMLANTGKDRNGDVVPATLIAIDRAQQVTGFSRVNTQGTPLHFMASRNGEAFVITSRLLNGITWNYLEQFDDGYMSDCGVKVSNTAFDDYTATLLQTVFTYTFTSPTLTTDVAVWQRFNATDPWVRVTDADYTVGLGTQTVTFATGRPVDELIHINARQNSVSLTGVAEHLDTETVYVHGDGLPIGNLVVASNAITFGDFRYDFECEIGLSQYPLLVLHPYKGRGDMSPTMKKQRIFRTLLQIERTGAISVGMAESATKPVSLQNYDSGLMDPTLEESLFTGAKRVSGIGRWQLEPTIVISQLTPMPFLIRSITYDVRF